MTGTLQKIILIRITSIFSTGNLCAILGQKTNESSILINPVIIWAHEMPRDTDRIRLAFIHKDL
jgi:hypothetical protein